MFFLLSDERFHVQRERVQHGTDDRESYGEYRSGFEQGLSDHAHIKGAFRIRKADLSRL